MGECCCGSGALEGAFESAAGIRPNLLALPQTSLRSANEPLTLFDTPLYVVIYTSLCYHYWLLCCRGETFRRCCYKSNPKTFMPDRPCRDRPSDLNPMWSLWQKLSFKNRYIFPLKSVLIYTSSWLIGDAPFVLVFNLEMGKLTLLGCEMNLLLSPLAIHMV